MIPLTAFKGLQGFEIESDGKLVRFRYVGPQEFEFRGRLIHVSRETVLSSVAAVLREFGKEPEMVDGYIIATGEFECGFLKTAMQTELLVPQEFLGLIRIR